VIATGGLSIPTLGGATGFGYQLAEQFGLPVRERLASLVPMTLTGRWHDISNALSGVALPVVVSTVSAKNAGNGSEQSFASDMLFTHRGISGPAILQLSNYWRSGEEISIDLLPSMSIENFIEKLFKTKKSTPNLLLKTYLGNYFPKSFVPVFLNDYFAVQSSGQNGQNTHKDTDALQLFKNEELQDIAQHFKCWVIKPSGTEGYRTAEVTLGGVDVDYLSSKTMEVAKQKGLFFIGETVDVTAHLGGYNFQWAWSSGYVAGMNV
jgi:predicted Rossmann fold flavoprotein